MPDHFANIGFPCPTYANPADFLMSVTYNDDDELEKYEKMWTAHDLKIYPIVAEEICKRIHHNLYKLFCV